MAKKTHQTYSDEYKFLKSKIQKVLMKASSSQSEMQRARKRIKKFVRRLIEIEQIHKRMGWPHPESIGEIDPNTLNERLKKAEMPEPRAALMPDGSLPKHDKLPASDLKVVTNPDGTLPSKKLPEEVLLDTKSTPRVIPANEELLDIKKDIKKVPNEPKIKALTHTKSLAVTPDGTLASTPMMEGSDPKCYSDEQVEKFFNTSKDEDE